MATTQETCLFIDDPECPNVQSQVFPEDSENDRCSLKHRSSFSESKSNGTLSAQSLLGALAIRQLNHRPDHPDRGAVYVPDDVTTIQDKAVIAIRSAEAVFVSPIVFTRNDDLLKMASHVRQILGMDAGAP